MVRAVANPATGERAAKFASAGVRNIGGVFLQRKFWPGIPVFVRRACGGLDGGTSVSSGGVETAPVRMRGDCRGCAVHLARAGEPADGPEESVALCGVDSRFEHQPEDYDGVVLESGADGIAARISGVCADRGVYWRGGRRNDVGMAIRKALVTAASGIGDVLRVTPLIRMCAYLGYEVDVLVAPDYPETATLLQGAPDIHQLYCWPSRWSGQAGSHGDALPSENYDLATFTYWSSTLRPQVRAEKMLWFDPRKWLSNGDSACVAAVAQELGWTSAMPAPFAMKSERKFGLKPGT